MPLKFKKEEIVFENFNFNLTINFLILQNCYAFTTLTHGLSECAKFFFSVNFYFVGKKFLFERIFF